VPSDVDPSVPEQRIAEQAVRLPPGCAVTGWASLRMRGVGYLDGVDFDGMTRLPVPLAMTSGRIRASKECALLHGPVHDGIETIWGIPCTSMGRALLDEMRHRPLVRAIVAMDMTSAAGLTTVGHQRSYTAGRTDVRGAAQALRALTLARDGSMSPNETRLRLIWNLAGLPEPLLNQPLLDPDGIHLATPDLFDPSGGLAGEFDGADHRTAERHQADVLREDRLRHAGVEVIRVTGPELRRPRLVVDRLLAARERAAHTARRDWQLAFRPPG
jgi:hypothetical protein